MVVLVGALEAGAAQGGQAEAAAGGVEAGAAAGHGIPIVLGTSGNSNVRVGLESTSKLIE